MDRHKNLWQLSLNVTFTFKEKKKTNKTKSRQAAMMLFTVD